MRESKKENTRQALNKVEDQKHVILTCTNAAEAKVQGKFYLLGETVTDEAELFLHPTLCSGSYAHSVWWVKCLHQFPKSSKHSH